MNAPTVRSQLRTTLAIAAVVPVACATMVFGHSALAPAGAAGLQDGPVVVTSDPTHPQVRTLNLKVEGTPGQAVTLNRETILRTEPGSIVGFDTSQTKVNGQPTQAITVTRGSTPGGSDTIIVDGNGTTVPAGSTVSITFSVDTEGPAGSYTVKPAPVAQPTSAPSDSPDTPTSSSPASTEETSPESTSSDSQTSDPASTSTTDSTADPEGASPDPSTTTTSTTTTSSQSSAESTGTEANDEDAEHQGELTPDEESQPSEPAVSPSVRRSRVRRNLTDRAANPRAPKHGDFNADVEKWDIDNHKAGFGSGSREYDRTMQATLRQRGVLDRIALSGESNFSQSKRFYSVKINGVPQDFTLRNISVLGDRHHPVLDLKQVDVKPGDVITVKYRQDDKDGFTANDVEFYGRAYATESPLPALPARSCAAKDVVWVGDSSDYAPTYATGLSTQPYNTGAHSVSPRGEWGYRALAYDPADHWIYAVSQHGPFIDGDYDGIPGQHHLLQINPDTGEVHRIGALTGDNEIGETPEVTSGFFANNGHYYIASGDQLLRVDRDTLTTHNLGFVNSRDHAALSPASPYAFGVSDGQIERIGLNTSDSNSEATIDYFDVPGLPDEIQGAWLNGDGTLSFSGDGKVYRVRVTNPNGAQPSFELVDTSAASPVLGDATSVPGCPADLGVTKVFDSYTDDGLAQWKVTVTNHGPEGTTSHGIRVTDTVPDTFDNVAVKPEGDDAMVSAEDGSNTIEIRYTNLPAGESRELTVTAHPKRPNDRCVDNGVEVTGLDRDEVADNNRATVTQCLVNVSKRVYDEAVRQEDGSYTVRYQVTVSNPNAKTIEYGPLTDKPEFGSGTTITGIAVDSHNGEATNPEIGEDGSFVITDRDTIAIHNKKSFTVTVNYTLDDATFNPDDAECTDDPQPGHGLYNTVSLPEGHEVQLDDNDACAPIPLPDKPSLRIEKRDASDDPQPLTGSGFTIYKGDSTSGDPVYTLDSATDENGDFTVDDLPYGDYTLVETKAPNNYFLLPRAVAFTVAPSEDGPVVTLKDQEDAALVGTRTDKDNNIVYITVADLLDADLPLTGGHGVLPFLGLGAVLFGAGVLLIRRRRIA